MILSGIKGLREASVLPLEHRPKIIESELVHNRKHSLSFHNEGMQEVLKRQVVVAVMHTPQLRPPPKPTVVLITQNNEVVGEEVHDPEKLKSLQAQRETMLLGRNFVIYTTRLRRVLGKRAKFVMPPLPFPEVQGVGGIKNVVSASPSPETDTLLRHLMGWRTTDPAVGTLLIGYNTDT